MSESAKRERDRTLRRAILDVLYHNRASVIGGWTRGRFVARVLADTTEFGDELSVEPRERDELLLSLMHDLMSKGYITIRDNRRLLNETYGLDVVSVAITGRGVDLCTAAIPPDPAIADERRA